MKEVELSRAFKAVGTLTKALARVRPGVRRSASGDASALECAITDLRLVEGTTES